MEIQFYLNEQPVQAGFFKKFSSRCDTWLEFIDHNEPALSYINSTLKLVYSPYRNMVEAFYDKDIRLVQWMDEEIRSLYLNYNLQHDGVLEKI